MQLKDPHRLKSLNMDDLPDDLQPDEVTHNLNFRLASSTEESQSGQAETLQSEVKVLLNVDAAITYYGQPIGGQFLYSGYSEVQIGSQVWMKKNWDAKYPGSKVYDDDEDNRGIYGGLYTWDQIMSSDFCPDGWHVPTEAEINTLLTYLGGAMLAGGHLKEVGDSHWTDPNTGADDSYGFRALPGGKFDTLFEMLGANGYLWLKDEEVDTVTDADGNVYATVIIGNQEWMMENLKTTKYNDGTPIPNIAGDAAWVADVAGAYSWMNNDIANKNKYGALYNFYAVNNVHGLAPTGWRVPTEADITTLIAFLGGTTGGGKLKQLGTTTWAAPNTGATDEYGFNAPASGDRGDTGVFQDESYCWEAGTSTQDSGFWGFYALGFITPNIDYQFGHKYRGFTIRCMRDVV